MYIHMCVCVFLGRNSIVSYRHIGNQRKLTNKEKKTKKTIQKENEDICLFMLLVDVHRHWHRHHHRRHRLVPHRQDRNFVFSI